MKKIMILLIFAVKSFTMEPEQNVSRILCTHESIHRDLLKEHTAQYGLDPEDANEWKEWEQIPKTIQKSLCNYYYDRQYQSYKNGCTKKGWAKGSVPSLLKFIGAPFDQNMLYENVPAITNVRAIMPNICLLKKMTSVIPFDIQQTHIKELLKGAPYIVHHQMSTLQPLACITKTNKKHKVSALICNEKSIFVGFDNGRIKKWDYQQFNTTLKYSYKAHSTAVNALLVTENYLISAGETIKVRMQENGMVYRILYPEKPILLLCLINKEFLVSANNYDAISVWNFKKGEILFTCNLPLLRITSLSCSDEWIIVSGSPHIFENKSSLFFLNTGLNSALEYHDYCKYIDSTPYYNKGNLITCGDDGIFFSRTNNNGDLEPFARYCSTDGCCRNFIDRGNIAFYNTKNGIKTFNLVPQQNGYLSHTFQCNSNPTQLTPFQDGFVSGHCNGDVIVWSPSEPIETWYKKNTAVQIALLQFAYQPTIHPEDSENNSLCSIQ